VLYPVEESRGYQARGDLWSPGYYTLALRRNRPGALVASTESFEAMTVLDSTQALEAERQRRRRLIGQAVPAAREGQLAELVLAALYPTLNGLIARYLAGTDFGIRVDPVDGLLVQGAPDLQLTWMDEKVDDWVVTPRRGKAVEINSLWYNALRLMSRWARESS